ncbi:MAG: lipopolysaccharide heptosyltransferase II [Acidobacteria bacterium]|jgi:heptosyltransferase-2|nr:lipopolysaccharide heptosyltransferase II [Acidobacteriota bacterium]
MSTVIRSPNWIGDGIMCLPALRAFKEHFPKERLAVAAKSYLADIFLEIAEIDEIIRLPDRWSPGSFLASMRGLRKKRFDRGILFTNSFSSALFFRLAGIGSRAGYSRDGRGGLLSERVPSGPDRGHQQYYYLQIIEHLAGKRSRGEPDASLAVHDAEKAWADAWLREQGLAAGQPLLAVAPGAAYGSAKAWPADRYRELVRSWSEARPGAAVLLLGGPAERETAATVAAGQPGRVLDLAGRLSLRRSIAVLSRCRLFVGNDSGLMHIAAALGLPVVAVFGPTEPGRTSPLAGRFRLLHHGADCAPCRHRACPVDHRCMTAVGVGEALAAAAELWEDGR